MSACIIMPNGVVADYFNSELQEGNPKLRLNNVDPVKFGKNRKFIDLPDFDPNLPQNNPNQKEHWYPNGSWFEIDGQPSQIQNINPIKRLLRRHFIKDFNSNSFRILPKENGLTLRIEFETNGNEIKGWYHGALIKRNRDSGAADGNILPPKGSEYPFIEIDLNVFSIDGDNIIIGQPTEDDVRIGMRFDGNGFLELFDGIIGSKIRGKIREKITSSWALFANKIEDKVRDSLNPHIDELDLNLSISQLSFDGDRVNICLGLAHDSSGIDRIFSYFTHTLDDSVKDLFLIGPNVIDGTGNDLDNFLKGNNSGNVLTGLGGNDQLYGLLGNDLLKGGFGNDLLDGGAGNDSLIGGEGDDLYQIRDTGDVVSEEENQGHDLVEALITYTLGEHLEDLTLVGTDSIDGFGNSLSNQLLGNAGSNQLEGRDGDDTLEGRAGDDYLGGGAGNDVITGGDGVDTVHYEDVGDVTVDLELGQALDGYGTTDTLSEIENITGSEIGNDTLIGDAQDNLISGRGGDDSIRGGLGGDNLHGDSGSDIIWGDLEQDAITGDADEIFGGDGDDTIHAGGGDDIVSEGTSTGDDQIWADAGNDVVESGIGNDTVYGGTGDDSLFGQAGDDHLLGEAGDDCLNGGEGSDTLDGGAGFDKASYADASGPLLLNLMTGIGGGVAGSDTLIRIEGIEGTEYRDRIIGDEGDNWLSGLGGDDAIDGRDGDDTLLGGEGWDRLTGYDGDDVLDGGVGDDVLAGDLGQDELQGGDGNDLLEGGAGDDTLDGGAGDDFAYGGEGDDVLAGDTGQDYLEGGVGNDTLLGGDGADILDGYLGQDNLSGGNGDDLLNGGAGNDTLAGGPGSDVLTGGGGNDTFVIREGDGTTVVTDFGGIGTGITPDAATLVEADILQFEGDAFSVRTMSLNQVGEDLIVSFEGVEDTQVILENFTLEDLDNIGFGPETYSPVGNVRFLPEDPGFESNNGEFEDVFDVFNADWQRASVINRDSVTFLNDLDNATSGLDDSDDVIHGLGGNDVLLGGSGDDALLGGGGDDLLEGGFGLDTLTGGAGADRFVLAADTGVDTVLDFSVGEDTLVLADGLDLSQIEIIQGIGTEAQDTLLVLQATGEQVGILTGVQANTLMPDSFATV